jgi:hypothetical protein
MLGWHHDLNGKKEAMRKQPLAVSTTMIIALVLATAVAAVAADPIIGTWKLNIAKSKFSSIYYSSRKRTVPKEKVEAYREIEGDQLELAGKEIGTDGSSSSGISTWARQGGITKHQPPEPAEMSVFETLIAPGDWIVTSLQNGKQIRVMHKVISKDGKQMTQTITGTDAQGKPFVQVQVFDRQ